MTKTVKRSLLTDVFWHKMNIYKNQNSSDLQCDFILYAETRTKLTIRIKSVSNCREMLFFCWKLQYAIVIDLVSNETFTQQNSIYYTATDLYKNIWFKKSKIKSRSRNSNFRNYMNFNVRGIVLQLHIAYLT